MEEGENFIKRMNDVDRVDELFKAESASESRKKRILKRDGLGQFKVGSNREANKTFKEQLRWKVNEVDTMEEPEVLKKEKKAAWKQTQNPISAKMPKRVGNGIAGIIIEGPEFDKYYNELRKYGVADNKALFERLKADSPNYEKHDIVASELAGFKKANNAYLRAVYGPKFLQAKHRQTLDPGLFPFSEVEVEYRFREAVNRIQWRTRVKDEISQKMEDSLYDKPFKIPRLKESKDVVKKITRKKTRKTTSLKDTIIDMTNDLAETRKKPKKIPILEKSNINKRNPKKIINYGKPPEETKKININMGNPINSQFRAPRPAAPKKRKEINYGKWYGYRLAGFSTKM